MIQVHIDLKPLSKALRYMSDKQRSFAISDALNRAMDGMFTTGKRAIPQQANVAQGDVARAMIKIPAKRGGLIAVVQATERWLPASYSRFRARQSGSGASFTPWKGTQTIKGGFIATMPSGHTSIFKRGPTTRRGRNRSALPIHDVGWGPNIAVEMVRPDQPAAQAIRAVASERFMSRFASNFERITGEAKAKFGL